MQNIKETFLILQYRILKSTVLYSTAAGIQGLTSSEQARRVIDLRMERRWEMVELKDHQQGDGGQAATSLTPDIDEARVQVSESPQLEGS